MPRDDPDYPFQHSLFFLSEEELKSARKLLNEIPNNVSDIKTDYDPDGTPTWELQFLTWERMKASTELQLVRGAKPCTYSLNQQV